MSITQEGLYISPRWIGIYALWYDQTMFTYDAIEIFINLQYTYPNGTIELSPTVCCMPKYHCYILLKI